MKRAYMDSFIDTIEWIAAGFVGIVAANIFLAVLLRNTLNYSIPDSFDIGRMLLGILIFWGIAATSYRGTHITVDLVWSAAGPRAKRWIDVFATLVLLFVVTVQTIMLFDKVRTTRADNVLTYDLTLPVWPFFLVAWLGDVSAVLLIGVRTWRLVFRPDRVAAVAGPRHGAHGRGHGHAPVLRQETQLGRARFAVNERECHVAAQDDAALAREAIRQAARKRTDTGDGHDAERDARKEHAKSAQAGTQLAQRQAEHQWCAARSRRGRSCGGRARHIATVRAALSMQTDRSRTTRSQRRAREGSWVTSTSVVPCST